LNHAMTRVDGPVKVTGAARYSYDVHLPGMLYGRVLRAPHARAVVKKIDLSAALKVPAVKAAVEGLKGVGYAGAPVAAVAAVTPERAEDGLRAIVVEYEVLPHIVRAEDSMRPDAPKIYEEGNVHRAGTRGDKEKVAAALATCDAVVEAEYRTPMIHHSCLETHGNVVDYRGGAEATVYASTQWTFSIPEDAAHELCLQQSAVTPVVEHMGGGFG